MAHRILLAVLALYWSVSASALDFLAECPAAIDLVVTFEVVGPTYYTRHLQRPIWPGGASGATIGIGYDLGHQVPPVIRRDWVAHPQVDDLPAAAGAVGQAGKEATARIRHVQTPLRLAEQVFTASTVPRYWAMTRRAFPGIDALPPCTQGAMFSLVYNRGSGMAGRTRIEMRTIRDQCIPFEDRQCIADEIVKMTRLWKGTTIEKGMTRRRQAEANLALR